MQNLPVTLRPGKVKNIILVLISIAFMCMGIALIEKNLWVAILTIFLFGISLLVFSINLIPNTSYLKIDERGLEMKNLFRTTFIPWQVISDFTTKQIFLNKVVMFNIDENFLRISKMKSRQGAFPDTYGMSAKKLATLLNDYKNQLDNR
ncbi:PH domain-containing protein [Chryseobacterium taiwanense]|nr:PH domain-containing protein [Chryseobacterium taiwanense]